MVNIVMKNLPISTDDKWKAVGVLWRVLRGINDDNAKTGECWMHEILSFEGNAIIASKKCRITAFNEVKSMSWFKLLARKKNSLFLLLHNYLISAKRRQKVVLERVCLCSWWSRFLVELITCVKSPCLLTSAAC